jgi:hypothetical protein
LFAKGALRARGFAHFAQRSYANTKPNEKKGDPAVCDPSLRYGHPAVLTADGVSLQLAALRQSRALIRQPFRSSAQTQGVGEEIPTAEIHKYAPWRVLVFVLVFGIRFFACPVLAGLRSAEASGSGLAIV